VESDTNKPYDLIVVGEAPTDVFDGLKFPISRPGGATYSAAAASALGAMVGIVAGVGDDEIRGMLPAIHDLGIDLRGIFRFSGQGLEYRIRNINEIFPQQVTVRRPQGIELNPSSFPSEYTNTRCLLCYPMRIPFLGDIAQRTKERGGIVCADLQHGIYEIQEWQSFISLTDILFSSRDELLHFTKSTNDQDAVKVLRNLGAKLIIVKYGIGGSTAYPDAGDPIQIPAFLANFKCTIGAGDVYNAVFALRYVSTGNLHQAGVDAALAASVFSEHLNFQDWVTALSRLDFTRGAKSRTSIIAHPEQLSSTEIYLVGHFLSEPMRYWVDAITQVLEAKGFSVFSPYRDAGLLTSQSTDEEKRICFENDVKALDRADFVVALLDGLGRGGTSWEIGYAYARGKPIFGILTDTGLPLSNMMMMSCKTIDNSLVQFINHIMEYIMDRQSQS